MDIHEYSKKALRTDYADYSNFHTGDSSPRLDYGAIGLVTESAKVLDLIKKSKKNINPLAKDKLKEELGDLLWYMNLVINELNLTFTDLMESNLEKIERKYPVNDIELNKLIRGE